jgi:hypothetical protein
MSVAAPLALDLDERPMPEPAQYPRSRRQARPRTAPAVLETSSNQTGSYFSPSQSNSGNSGSMTLSAPSIVVVPSSPHPNADAVVGEPEDDSDNENNLEMDHLPPPRRPNMVCSLSSVDQARRRGIQV